LGLHEGEIRGLIFVAKIPGDHAACGSIEGGVDMGRHIRVTAVRKEKPEVRLYVLALIALARQLQEEEERQAANGQAGGSAAAKPGEEASHERG
jgi:hypothetical protein